MAKLEIIQIPVLNDNYVYLLHEAGDGAVAVVDPAVTEEVLKILDQFGWKLTHILNTHHHPDHTGGNLLLKELTGARIIGPRAEQGRIPGLNEPVGDGDEIRIGQAVARVFDVPGHTSGHIAYWFEESAALFCGDTLFALGCGRVFEGTPQQMWSSLEKLAALPDETHVYCAHEYTQSNARFAVTIDPENEALKARVVEIDSLRAHDRPTVPSTLGQEKATNPFLRPASRDIQKTLGMVGADPVSVFAEVRRRKDSF